MLQLGVYLNAKRTNNLNSFNDIIFTFFIEKLDKKRNK